jgi:hypothetical protein
MIFRALIRYSIDRPPFTIMERSALERKKQIDHLRAHVDPHLEVDLAEYPDPEDEGKRDDWFEGVTEQDDCE